MCSDVCHSCSDLRGCRVGVGGAELCVARALPLTSGITVISVDWSDWSDSSPRGRKYAQHERRRRSRGRGCVRPRENTAEAAREHGTGPRGRRTGTGARAAETHESSNNGEGRGHVHMCSYYNREVTSSGPLESAVTLNRWSYVDRNTVKNI